MIFGKNPLIIKNTWIFFIRQDDSDSKEKKGRIEN